MIEWREELSELRFLQGLSRKHPSRLFCPKPLKGLPLVFTI